MAISAPHEMKRTFEQLQGIGAKAKSSDATLIIHGYEQYALLVKQFPWPVATTGGEIESFGPCGLKVVQPQHPETYQQGPVAIYETEKGHADEFLVDLLKSGATFEAEVIEGTPDKPGRRKRIYQAFIKVDAAERDWENTTQTLILNGTLHYHYFAD